MSQVAQVVSNQVLPVQVLPHSSGVWQHSEISMLLPDGRLHSVGYFSRWLCIRGHAARRQQAMVFSM